MSKTKTQLLALAGGGSKVSLLVDTILLILIVGIGSSRGSIHPTLAYERYK